MAIPPEVATARARLAAAKRWSPDADTTEIERDLKTATLADRLHKIVEVIASENPFDEWADRVCAALPPMTPEQITAAAIVLSRIEGNQDAGKGGARNDV